MPGRRVTAREQELIDKANRYLPGGGLGNVFSDVVIREGRGARVWDVSGNEYVDYLLGSGPMLVGHAHPQVVAAVREQIERGTTFFANNEQAILLAEEIVKAVPCAEKVRFSSSGSEATLFAMRTARAYRKCDKILKFEGGFHGMNDYSLMSMAPAQPLDFPHPTPDSAGIPRSIQGEVLIAPFKRYRDHLGHRGAVPRRAGRGHRRTVPAAPGTEAGFPAGVAGGHSAVRDTPDL